MAHPAIRPLPQAAETITMVCLIQVPEEMAVVVLGMEEQAAVLVEMVLAAAITRIKCTGD
jgi:hypothetical protein